MAAMVLRTLCADMFNVLKCADHKNALAARCTPLSLNCHVINAGMQALPKGNPTHVFFQNHIKSRTLGGCSAYALANGGAFLFCSLDAWLLSFPELAPNTATPCTPQEKPSKGP